MPKRIIISVTILLLIAACGNKSEKEKTDHEHEGHSMPTGTIPDLPAIADSAKVFFANLKDGDKVKSPFKVEFGASGIGVDTAGPVIAGVGHHHIIVNNGDSITMSSVIPADSTHIHFGKAQKATTLYLPAGKYRLAMQFADGLHRSYGQKLSAAINIEVQ